MPTARKHLSTRERLRLFTLHGGICHICKVKIDGARERWEISHEIAFEMGGADDDKNRKPAHYRCHREQTAKVDIPVIAKAKRREARYIGAKAPSQRPLPGGRNSKYKIKIGREVVLRNPTTSNQGE